MYFPEDYYRKTRYEALKVSSHCQKINQILVKSTPSKSMPTQTLI